jgi:hypothetical protein
MTLSKRTIGKHAPKSRDEKKATLRWLSGNPRVYKLWSVKGKRKPVFGQSKPVIDPIL